MKTKQSCGMAELKRRLAEAEETLRAIRSGEVDALIVSTKDGEQVFTLKGAEQPYRTMVEMLSEGAATLSADGTVIYCNQRLADILRVPLEKIIGTSIFQFIYPPNREPFEDDFHKSLSEIRRGESVFRTPGGTFIPVLLSLRAFSTAEEPTYVCLVATDISDIRHSQEELRKSHANLEAKVRERTAELQQSEEMYRLATEAANDAIWDLNLIDGSTRWSNIYAAHFGRPKKTAGSVQWWLDRIHPEERERAMSSFQQAVEGNAGTWECEYRFQKKEGGWAAIYDRAYIARDESGKAWRVIGSMSDITERKRWEVLNKSLDDISSCILSSHDLGQILKEACLRASMAVACDSAAVSLYREGRWVIQCVYGFPDELVGVQTTDEEEPQACLAVTMKEPVIIGDTLHDDRVNQEHMTQYAIRSAMVIPIISMGKSMGVLSLNFRKDPFHFSDPYRNFAIKLVTSLSLAVTNAQLYEKVLTELADREKNEREMDRKNKLLEAANMELESFSYSVSHDLRTPLRAVDGYSQMLAKEIGENVPENVRKRIAVIRDNIRKMGHLIDDLLALSRLGRQNMTTDLFSMDDLIREVWREMPPLDQQRVVEFLVLSPLPPAYGDRALIKQAVANLLLNARKFTGPRNPGVIQFGGSNKEDASLYYVKDNGVGFDMRYVNKIFDVFQRLHSEEEFGGTGIGLAIVQRIIKRHRGEVWADAEVDKGATLYFMLPKSQGH